MKVEHKRVVDEYRSLEIGEATWGSDRSIRNRRDLDGRFNYGSSSEVPMFELPSLVAFAAEFDELGPSEIGFMLTALSESLNRQLFHVKLS